SSVQGRAEGAAAGPAKGQPSPAAPLLDARRPGPGRPRHADRSDRPPLHHRERPHLQRLGELPPDRNPPPPDHPRRLRGLDPGRPGQRARNLLRRPSHPPPPHRQRRRIPPRRLPPPPHRVPVTQYATRAKSDAPRQTWHGELRIVSPKFRL